MRCVAKLGIFETSYFKLVAMSQLVEPRRCGLNLRYIMHESWGKINVVVEVVA